MLFRHNVLAFAALYILFVNGQAPPPPPIVVQAGFQGTVYTPETVTAALNATVAFQFFGNVHTVTQSSFEDPCSPLPGGFHSGYIRGLNITAPVQIWNLVVTNVNAPIWFFCATTSPTFHCSDGMIGAINPPSQAMFSQFSSAAIMITTTATVNPTPTLTGQGAFASSTPTPSFAPAPIGSSPTTSSAVTLPTSTSSTSTPSSTPTAASTTSNVGAIVGGAVGGSVGFIGLVLVVCWLFFLRKKRSHTTDPDDSLRYPPGRRPTEAFVEVQRPETFYPNTASVISNTNTNSFSPTDRLVPVRPSGSTGPVVLQPPYIGRQESAPSDLASSSSNPPSTLGRNAPDQSSSINMRALAQEVAAVLSQNSQSLGHKNPQDLRAELAVQNHDQDDASSQTTDRPPTYHAATGSSTIGLPGHGPKRSI